MKRNVYNKSIFRSIKGSLGRYLAILAIIALGVGFFAGVKNTKPSMMLTCNDYVFEMNMYDYRLLSNYGFGDDEVNDMLKTAGVAEAEGGYTQDFFSLDTKGNSVILRAHSITDKINKVDIISGRMPEKEDECLADSHSYNEGDIGKTIVIGSNNKKSVKDSFKHKKLKITGIMNSTNYLVKTERGTTSLRDGRVDAYIYMPEDGFDMECYTEMLVTCAERGFIFSDEYNNNIEAAEDKITAAAENGADNRRQDIIDEAMEEIDEGQAEIDEGWVKLRNEETSARKKLDSAKKKLDKNKKSLASGKKQLNSKRDSLEKDKAKYEKDYKKLSETIAAAESGAVLIPEEQLAQMKAQASQLNAGIKQINEGLKTIKSKEKQISKGEKELKTGYSKYYSSKETAQTKIAQGEAKLKGSQKDLDEAKEEIEDMDAAEVYVYTREDNSGYASYDSNTDIVNSIAKVFPIFFFLIAALVCSTTMTRMVEDEKVQIGSFRALGYTRGRIMKKYMIYAGSASIIGSVCGFFLGSKFFPYAIWIAYGMMFGFTDLEYYMNWQVFIGSVVVSIICACGTTYFACRKVLGHTPAQIMRPEAPKAGKRVILERIPFIWNRLRFLHKVTIRNIFRYKKRMAMMVVGIAGCTALVLAGFGIFDSVAGVAEDQYKSIEVYDIAVGFDDVQNEKDKKKLIKDMDGDVTSVALIDKSSVDVQFAGQKRTMNLMATGDKEITDAVHFKTESGEALAYPAAGEGLINHKTARVLGIKTGDKVKILYDDTKSVTITISGIYKNYVQNYIYISDKTYEETLHKKYEPEVGFVTLSDDVSVKAAAEKLNKYDSILAVSANNDVMDNVSKMMVSLNYIVYLVIGCAGLLAFIVLFNLSNINITERIREIATIRVLGFYNRETGSYVFRENLILVLMGIAVGLPLGHLLHRFIMAQIVVDAIAFNEVISNMSYVYSALVVIGFSLIVDVIMRLKLKKINMAEALKSVD